MMLSQQLQQDLPVKHGYDPRTLANNEMSESQSSFQSNLSGTFNNKTHNLQNDSLKIQQRKQQKKQKQQSESQSLGSSLQNSQYQSLNQSEQDIKQVNYNQHVGLKQLQNNNSKIPPPPMINFNINAQKQTKPTPGGQTQIRPPPPMMVMISDGEKNKDKTPRQQTAQSSNKHSKQSSSNSSYNPFGYQNEQNIGKKQVKDQDEVNNTILEEEEQSMEQSKIHKDHDIESVDNNLPYKTQKTINNKYKKQNTKHAIESDSINSIDDADHSSENEFMIRIDVSCHSNFPENIKIPNPNYNILEQAKYLIMQEIRNNANMNSQNTTNSKENKELLLTEDVLSRTIKQIHIGLMKIKESEFEKIQSDYYKQVMSLQAQVSNLQQNTGGFNMPGDPLKKSLQQHFQKHLGTSIDTKQSAMLKDHYNLTTNSLTGTGTLNNLTNTGQLNDSMTNLYDQQKTLSHQEELNYQSQKTKELQTKYESEIENLRSQLKGSQSEQFIRQQVEHKKLIEDNSLLMREVKILQDQLREEQQKVLDLFEDAQTVREEIVNEMAQFEKMKRELEKFKHQNQVLRQRLGDQQNRPNNDSSSQMNGFDEEGGNFYDELENLEGFGGQNINKNKKVQKVSIGLSRPESLLSLANDFNQKLEDLIEQKSKSIVNMITKTQVNQFGMYQNPTTSINYQKQATSQFNQGLSPYTDNMQYPDNQNFRQQNPYQQQQQNIVEFSIYESENGGFHNNQNQESLANLENHQSSDSSHHYKEKILKSNSSDLQVLKHKIKQVRDQHTQKVQQNQGNNSSQNISHISSQQQLNNNHSQIIPGSKVLNANNSQTETFKAMNSGLITQENNQPISLFYRDNSSKKLSYQEQQNQMQKKQSEQYFTVNNNNGINLANQIRETETYNAPHYIQQFAEGAGSLFNQHEFLMTGQSSLKDKTENLNHYNKNMSSSQNDAMQLTHQFKTPVWTNQVNHDQEGLSESEEEDNDVQQFASQSYKPNHNEEKIVMISKNVSKRESQQYQQLDEMTFDQIERNQVNYQNDQRKRKNHVKNVYSP